MYINHFMNTIKKYFPIFNSPKNTHSSLVYLDNAATTQKPACVIDKLIEFYTQYNSNVHRGLYELGESTTTRYEKARTAVAKFINAKHHEEVIFTKGTTEGINFIADTWALAHLKPGDEIVLTIAEHHANLLPWQRVAKKTGAILRFIDINHETFLPEDPIQHITNKTKLVTLALISNVLGPLWAPEQLESIIKHAHTHGARVMIDAAQAVAHGPIDIQKLKPDFLVFSGHKVYGPTGIGVLYINKNLHDDIEPYQVGGLMVHNVTKNYVTWAQAPQKFEAGTPPIADALGLAQALEFISTYPWEDISQHENSLYTTLVRELDTFPGIKIVGTREKFTSNHLVSFYIRNIHAHDVANFLAQHNIAVRAGHHCTQPLINHLKLESLVRISIGIYNTHDDITHVINALKKLCS